jgi:hypothetical protein
VGLIDKNLSRIWQQTGPRLQNTIRPDLAKEPDSLARNLSAVSSFDLPSGFKIVALLSHGFFNLGSTENSGFSIIYLRHPDLILPDSYSVFSLSHPRPNDQYIISLSMHTHPVFKGLLQNFFLFMHGLIVDV